ncbi:TonB-dependent receptor [bacterium]|nr:TonB-dependent receptor [bacterium]
MYRVKISQLFTLKSDTVPFVLLRTWLVTKMKFSLPNIVSIICFSFTPLILAQQTAESFSAKDNLSGEAARVVNPGASDSTVIYEAEFFDQYNPITASDMLDRIPGIDVSGRSRGGGGRGLGTGGNLLIDGQRVAGKDNSARDQLDRITAAEVERIEIIRDTSGELNVRGSGEVINIILIEVPSRSSTQVELLQRLNHDNTYEIGGSVGWSTQIGNFQGLLNLEAQPNYENRDNREARITPEGELLGTLLEENIRDQDKQNISANMSYGNGAHRMQLNALFSVGDFPRSVRRDFVDFIDNVAVDSIQQERIDNEENNWELGGDYEYSFANGSRLAVLFVTNDEIRNSVRERFLADPASDPLTKNLYIDSQRETKEFIVQTNYNFSVTKSQSLRVGFERAVNELRSALFIAGPFGTEPASEEFGGLPLISSISNPGTQVEEERYEGFAFHNWTINDKSALETSIVYETSEIFQTGEVSKTRDFQFWRPSIDYRYNFADNFRFRGTVNRNVSQLSFSAFAATANDDDRDINGFAGNPELEPETSWSFNGELEYRLPNDAGVLATSLFYSDIDNKIGKIIATVDPDQPQSATGNVGPSTQMGWFARASIRLNEFNLPNAIFSGRVGLFDSEILNPFVNEKVRTGGRGFGNLGFRQDITSMNLSYGINYEHSFWGGYYDIDIVTRTRDDRRRSLDLFVQKIWFGDWVFRLESDNTLGASRCRYRERYEGTTIEGNVELIQDSCSSRYRRLILSIQTTF